MQGLLVVLVGGPALAADEFKLDLFRPVVSLAAEAVPPADFRDVEGDYSQRRWAVGLTLPLGAARARPDGKLLGYQLLSQIAFSASPTEFTLPGDVSRDRTLYTGAVRFAGLMVGGRGHLYVAAAGASFAEERETLGDLELRFWSLGFGTYRKNINLWFLYGGGVGFTEFGRVQPLPLFGVFWRFRPRWTLFTIAPAATRITYWKDRRLRWHFLLGATGERYRLANDGSFPGQSDRVFLRVRQPKLGTALQLRQGRDMSWVFEAGLQAGRRFKLVDEDEDVFFDERLRPAGYLKLSWQVRFGETILDRVTDGLPWQDGGP